MGELLEDGVLRVGVSGTLVSMRIGPRACLPACLEAWRFQGTRGGREWLEGPWSLSEHAAVSASAGFALRLMRDMTDSPAGCAYIRICCGTLVAPSFHAGSVQCK